MHRHTARADCFNILEIKQNDNLFIFFFLHFKENFIKKNHSNQTKLKKIMQTIYIHKVKRFHNKLDYKLNLNRLQT